MRFRIPNRVWAGLGLALALGAGLASLDEGGFGLQGWFAYSLLLGLGLGLLVWVHRRVAGDARIARIAGAAFLVRLLIGILLALSLPVHGYQDNAVTGAGYVFYDAFIRDQQAWDLADSGQQLWTAFQGEYSGDQYGGMLAISAATYRYLSPDVHRPALILLLTAAAGALGVLFLWKAAGAWFNPTVALAAAWIYALYPEAVLLGGSQMREPFLMAGSALGFYGLTEMRAGGLRRSAWLLAAGVVLFLFSPPVALVAFGVLAGLWALDTQRRFSWRQAAFFAGVLLLGGLLVFYILAQYPSLERAGPWRIWAEWLEYNFGFQAHLLERSSGWVQKLFQEAGARWESAIVILYGIARPVLPAVLVEPAPWIWRLIGTLRAAGWYALAPLLVYGATRVWKAEDRNRRAQLVWLSLAVWIGIIGSAFIAGGDQIDNPRYRAILIAWEALLAAWAWWWARSRRDAWLGRWLLVEAVFVLFFTQWYVSRYYRIIGRLPFWQMVAAILAISGLILAGGWLRDRRRKI